MLEGRRGMAFIRELDNTRSLLGTGVVQLFRDEWTADSLAPLLTCLSGGVERLLKLTMGLASEVKGEPWPTNFQKLYGHRLEELRPDVETQMESRLSAAAGEPYIR